MRYQSPENMEMRGSPAKVSRSEVWKTLLRSFGVASGLSLVLTYLLYVASPGLVIMEICEALAIPSSLAVQYFGVKLHSAFFETVVNSAFYTLLVFSVSILYRRTKTRVKT
jgi:hypothetical protein